jgi:DNA (cytosine-5)-methyltransferase 1
MTGPRIGSLFSGYGGLDMGVQAVMGGEVVWHVEYDAAPSKILEHHWPTVPNYGDVTTLDLTAVEPIDVLTAGYPCQPFSIAGKRKGSTDDRHLWPYVLTAIRHLRPRVVLLENVRGHLTLGFDRVLGDLAEAGYDADWVCLPASEAGAPHRRERIFILAYPRGEAVRFGAGLRASESTGVGGRRSDDNGVQAPTTDAGSDGGHEGRHADDGRQDWSGLALERRAGLGSASDSGSDEPERWGIGGDVGGPSSADESASGQRQRIRNTPGDSGPTDWAQFAPAVARWERVTGRIAPAPTVPDGRGGKHRLNAAFVEWMMGLPAGHVTDVGLTRNEELKALGNGVVWQQAALALRILLGSLPHNIQSGVPHGEAD